MHRINPGRSGAALFAMVLILASAPGHGENLVTGSDAVAGERTHDPALTPQIRVGVPLVARGPAPNIADSAFTAVELPDDRFRGFTAGGTTWAIDGSHPYDMGGAGVAVLRPGPPNTPDSCGQ